MDRTIYRRIQAMAEGKREQEASIAYLAEHLGHFLRLREHVLICFHSHSPGNISYLMEQAVLRCGGIPHVWGADSRWKTLLRLAFMTKSTTIIGAPLLVLGLTKLKKAYQTPLYVRKVVTAGYPSPPWMIDGIVKGFDCEMGGCYCLGSTGAVAGFACGHSWGVHLRVDTYGVDIAGRDGSILPEGETGEIVIYPKADPALRCATGEEARLVRRVCKCGSTSPRLIDFAPGKTEADKDLLRLGQELQSWTSILDCSLRRGESGLEIELVVIPGEKLPKLPYAAKLQIYDLDLETQEPFPYEPLLRVLE